MTWHAGEDLLDRYRAGKLSLAHAVSVEAHLVACAHCRAELGRTVDARRLDSTWATIETALDAPRLGPVERLLRRVGVSPEMARLLAATPSLRTSWMAAVTLALAFAVAAAHAGSGDRAVLLFLIVAPLLPLAGVATAFAPGLDPAAEVALVAPMRTFRLLLVRSVAVLGGTLMLTALAAVALPGPGWAAAAWLMPSLALVATTLALSTYVSAVTASVGIAVAWVSGVFASEVVAAGGVAALRVGGPIASAAFHAGGQVTFCIVAVVAGAVLMTRRHVFELGRAS